MDSGCECNVMREDECIRLGIIIDPLDQTNTNIPTQADGKSPLQIVGKAKFIAKRGKVDFQWEGYVCRNLQSAILCGGTFMEKNRVVQELANKRIVVANKYYILETSPLCPDPLPESTVSHSRFQNGETLEKKKEMKAEHSEAAAILLKIEIGSDVPLKIKEKLNAIHKAHASIFNGDISDGYNGYSGDHVVDFNFINNIPSPSSAWVCSIIHFTSRPSTDAS